MPIGPPRIAPKTQNKPSRVLILEANNLIRFLNPQNSVIHIAAKVSWIKLQTKTPVTTRIADELKGAIDKITLINTVSNPQVIPDNIPSEYPSLTSSIVFAFI